VCEARVRPQVLLQIDCDAGCVSLHRAPPDGTELAAVSCKGVPKPWVLARPPSPPPRKPGAPHAPACRGKPASAPPNRALCQGPHGPCGRGDVGALARRAVRGAAARQRRGGRRGAVRRVARAVRRPPPTPARPAAPLAVASAVVARLVSRGCCNASFPPPCPLPSPHTPLPESGGSAPAPRAADSPRGLTARRPPAGPTAPASSTAPRSCSPSSPAPRSRRAPPSSPPESGGDTSAPRAADSPPPRNGAGGSGPFSTEGGTGRVRLVREEGRDVSS